MVKLNVLLNSFKMRITTKHIDLIVDTSRDLGKWKICFGAMTLRVAHSDDNSFESWLITVRETEMIISNNYGYGWSRIEIIENDTLKYPGYMITRLGDQRYKFKEVLDNSRKAMLVK